MQGVNGIHRGLAGSWQLDALYSDLYDRWQELDARQHQIRTRPESDSRWNYWRIHPLASAIPFLANAGLTLTQSQPTHLNSGQTISQGLSDMFMAQDRYRREQLFAQIKEQKAEQMFTHDMTLNAIQNLANLLHHNGLMAELISRIVARDFGTSELIIRNI